jgi:hypothetical protein
VYSYSLQQLTSLFDLVTFGLFSRMWAMAAPLLSSEKNLDARAFSLMNFAAKAND